MAPPDVFPTVSVPVLEGQEVLQFRESVQPSRCPAVLRGMDLGECTRRWADPEYLSARVPPGAEAKVHVTRRPDMDFRLKNFEYRTMPLAEVFRKASKEATDGDELIYLRDVGRDPRGRHSALLQSDFPELAEDFRLPPGLFFDEARLFSSVLRVSSSGVRVWTHYDVMDNLYAQCVGRKRAILWAPEEASNLYLDGEGKSKIIDVERHHPDDFPRFSKAVRHVADLIPGDVLFIPALWPHNMKAESPGVAVNVFWKNLDKDLYDPKDAYGNRDLLPAAKADRMLDNVIRQLEGLPSDVKDFYGRRLIAKLERKCLTSPPK